VEIETGGDVKAPIILGRPFLSTAKAIIYTESSKICFNINGKKEGFTFKNKALQSPAHPQTPYIYENTTVKKKNKNKKKSKQPPVETVKMINSVHTEYDHLLVSPYLNKRGDPGVPTIECKINQRIFHKTFYDTGVSVNIMSKVMYEYLFDKEPLYSTYVQLQMVDQTFKLPEGIAKDVNVQIKDYYVPTDFMVLDMGEEEHDPPIVLGRPFVNTTHAIIYMRNGKVHF
jgi:hypothetical protein